MSAVDTANGEFQHVGIVGGGLMGSGIAHVVGMASFQTTLVERSRDDASAAVERLRASFDREVSRGRVEPQARGNAIDRISVRAELEALADCDLVIEAVTEDLNVKRDVWSRMATVTAGSSILASNTSSLPVSDLATVSGRAESVVGLHFFAPVPRMDLVEVVATPRTHPDVARRVLDFVTRIGKTPVQVEDRSGFIVNFLLIPYLLSAIGLCEQRAASAKEIDMAMTLGCAHPMGPLRLADLIGLDVVLAAAEAMQAEFGRAEYSSPPLLRRMVTLGMLGRKSGRGFYEYEGAA